MPLGRMWFYLLNDDHTVSDKPSDMSHDEWAMLWVRSRRVRWDQVQEGVVVSTIFLGIDHAYGGGPPVLFETMVDSDYGWDRQVRYHTWDEAVAGHEKIVEELTKLYSEGTQQK